MHLLGDCEEWITCKKHLRPWLTGHSSSVNGSQDYNHFVTLPLRAETPVFVFLPYSFLFVLPVNLHWVLCPLESSFL